MIYWQIIFPFSVDNKCYKSYRVLKNGAPSVPYSSSSCSCSTWPWFLPTHPSPPQCLHPLPYLRPPRCQPPSLTPGLLLDQTLESCRALLDHHPQSLRTQYKPLLHKWWAAVQMYILVVKCILCLHKGRNILSTLAQLKPLFASAGQWWPLFQADLVLWFIRFLSIAKGKPAVTLILFNFNCYSLMDLIMQVF